MVSDDEEEGTVSKERLAMRATVQLILTNASENQDLKTHSIYGTEGIIFCYNRLYE